MPRSRPGPAQLIVRWNDTGDTGPMACVESDTDGVTAEASTVAATPGERGMQISVAGMERGQEVTVDLGIPWPADVATTSVAVHLEPGAGVGGAILLDPAPVTVDVNHLAPAPSPLSSSARPTVPSSVSRAGRTPAVGHRRSRRGGDGPPAVGRRADGGQPLRRQRRRVRREADAVVCRWAEVDASASALVELVVVPGDPTCEFLVLCLDAEITWSGEPGASTTASTEVDLEGRPQLAVASFEVDGIRAFTVTNTSTGPVSDIAVVDPGCGPVTHTGPEVLEPAGTLVLTCGGSGPDQREVTATGHGSDGAAVSGSLVITPPD